MGEEDSGTWSGVVDGGELLSEEVEGVVLVGGGIGGGVEVH